MSTNNSQILFETYKLHAELARDIDSNREGLNKIYAGMVTSIIAASVLLYRLVPDVETIWMLPILGIMVSLSWMFSLHSITGKLCAKHVVLLDLEKELPFQFFQQEEDKFEKGRFLRRKYSGLIMPSAFLTLCVIWIGFFIVKQCNP